MKNAVMSKNALGPGNFVTSYKQKQGVFRQYEYCTVSQKRCKTVGTTKQTPKPFQIIAEMNAHVRRACMHLLY